MKTRFLIGLALLALVALVGWTLPTEASKQVEAPEQVVTGFYDWYLGYIGERENMRNPLVERAYRDSEYLSDAFIHQVDAVLDSFDKSAYDPFLLAQDIPERITVGENVLSGDKARVIVHMFWGGNPTPSERTVTVKLNDGQWEIVDIES